MRRNKGFTLVEILIVVIILGILAAIVIPQFTNASTDARNNSVQSTLQTVRSQLELYKLQHNDNPPSTPAGFMNVMTAKTLATEVATAGGTGTLGPYLQQIPTNPQNGWTTVAGAAAANVGWVYTVAGGTATIQATNSTGAGVLTY